MAYLVAGTICLLLSLVIRDTPAHQQTTIINIIIIAIIKIITIKGISKAGQQLLFLWTEQVSKFIDLG